MSCHALAVSAEALHAVLCLDLSYKSSSLTNSDIQACGSERYLWTCCGGCRFCKLQRILGWLARQICQKSSCQKFHKNYIIRIEITFMISHVKSCTEIHRYRKFLFPSEFTKTRQRDFVNFNFRTSETFISGHGPVQTASRSLSQARPWLPEHHLESRSDLGLPVRLSRPGLSGMVPVQVATGSQGTAAAARPDPVYESQSDLRAEPANEAGHRAVKG